MPAAHPDRPRHTVSTRYLRFPVRDWPLICRGVKTEFRLPVNMRWGPSKLAAPIPVVGYAMQRWARDADYRLFVITETRVEPLGAIAPASLRAEAFDDLISFKRYWRQRYQTRGWRPLDKVNVLTVRPFTEMDRLEMGEVILRHLYGPFLPKP